jgi:hypothetical protein
MSFANRRKPLTWREKWVKTYQNGGRCNSNGFQSLQVRKYVNMFAL